MAFLRATKGLEPGQVCDLHPGSNILGRNPEQCDVVLEHFAVSRAHARIESDDDAVFIEDLGSRNGVLVNGAPISPGPGGRRRLKSFDKIVIAAFEFIFEDESSSSSVLMLADETVAPEILSTVAVSSDSSHRVFKDRRGTKLRTVLAIIEELASAIDLEDVLPKIIESLFRAFPQAQNGYLLLRDDESGDYLPAAIRRFDGSDESIRISRTIVNQVVSGRQAVLSGDIASDPRFIESGSVRALKVHSMMCAPLIDSRSEVIGLIQLEVCGGRVQFTNDDLEVLAGVARHLAIMIENSRLHDAALQAQRTHFEERFRKLIEESIQGILIHRDFKPLFVNESWARLHGYTIDEVMRMDTILPLIFEEDRRRAVSYADARIRGEKAPAHYDARGVRKDGSVFWLEKFTTVIDWDGGRAIQSTVIDLTERKKADEVLRRSRQELETLVQERTAELVESEALYRSLVDHIPLCVARKDLDGRFTFVNRLLCNLLDRDELEILGRTDHDFFLPEIADKYRREDSQVATSGKLLESFETLPVPNGELLHAHTLKSPIYNAEQSIVGIQTVFSDITSLKKAEEDRNRYAQELERSNRDLEQFAYSVAHDLQSPLRTVASYCQLLQRRYEGSFDEDADEFLQGAVDGAKRMKRLLEDLLAYSRVTTEANQLRPTDAANVLKEVNHNLRAAIEENAAVVTHDPLPTITCDATQLMQLLQNLLANAIRYRREEPPHIHVGVKEMPEAWCFVVRDNGVGIDARHIDRIFLIFQRLYADHELPGSGVGLAICKRIVERHGGRIWVESQPDKGSEFYFTIPKNDVKHVGDYAI